MRIKGDKLEIQYTKTKCFFQNRAQKYKDTNPYGVTMYQDNNEELVKKRNEMEVKKVLPFLELNQKSRILDVACGIGRWADAIQTEVESYCGIDFSDKLIDIARLRNHRENFSFEVGTTNQLLALFEGNKWEPFNRIIIAGILMYLNDEDVEVLCSSIMKVIDNNTIIYIREPIAMAERLTLRDHHSVELNAEYNAIYRTKEEYHSMFERTMLKYGAVVCQEEGLFSADAMLNNRVETLQYYYILKVEK